MLAIELKNAIEVLTLSQNYKIIEKYQRPPYYNLDEHCEKFIGLFLDVETTGTNIINDKIIELGLVLFEYSADGKIFKILNEYSQYQDPKIPIPARITELTGISDDMVKNQLIDQDLFFEFFKQANLIIAHQAAFDRGFVETRFPTLAKKPWACSIHNIPWQQEGIESAKLEYLAYKFGFFYEGHRATIDCLAGLHILSKKLPKSGKLVFQALLEDCRKDSFKLWAANAPFESKDLLKARGYRWNAEGTGPYKAWYLELNDQQLLDEILFLWEEIYDQPIRLPLEIFNARNRFSIYKNTISEENKTSYQKRIEEIYLKAEKEQR